VTFFHAVQDSPRERTFTFRYVSGDDAIAMILRSTILGGLKFIGKQGWPDFRQAAK